MSETATEVMIRQAQELSRLASPRLMIADIVAQINAVCGIDVRAVERICDEAVQADAKRRADAAKRAACEHTLGRPLVLRTWASGDSVRAGMLEG